MSITPNNRTQIINENSEIVEHSEPIAFKELIRETSVYRHFVELKDDALTEQGFFDLEKVPGLYVSGAGQFLKNLRQNSGLKQKDIIERFNVSRSQMTHWENNRNRMPMKKLVKIAEALGISRNTIYSLIDQRKINAKNKLPTKFEKFRDVVKYFSPYESGSKGKWEIGITKFSIETCSKIETILKADIVSKSNQHALVRSKDLYTFLQTFFIYKKVPKIRPPLTRDVLRWYDDDIDLKCAIIIPCLQSDGGMKNHRQYCQIGFYGYNKVLHDYFVDAMYYEYIKLPTTYFVCSYITEYFRNSTKEILKDIMNLAGNVKTSPANTQMIEDYLKEPQPHLDYLINTSETEQQIALRIWASTEGSITAHRKDGKIYPHLEIGCAHPNLVEQLRKIARRFNINFSILSSKGNWSGIGGLTTSALSSCINFLKLGSFIKGVKIGGNSKYHEGIAKDVLLLGILEYKKRELENSYLKKRSIQQVHHIINKIIEERDYKTTGYYINYFS